MIHTMTRSLVLMASPILVLVYWWNNIKKIELPSDHKALTWDSFEADYEH